VSTEPPPNHSPSWQGAEDGAFQFILLSLRWIQEMHLSRAVDLIPRPLLQRGEGVGVRFFVGFPESL